MAMSYQITFVSGASLEAKISSLERRDLEEDVPLLSHISHQLSNFQFVRIVGLSRFWETSNKNPNESFSLQGCMEDVLTGLHGLSLPYAYLIVGEKRQLHFFKGVSAKSNGDVSALKTALTGSFPAIELQEPVDIATLDTILTNLPHRALMTGIPTAKQTAQEKETVREQIERLARGLYGERWAYLVLAEPLDIPFTTAAFDAIAAEIKQTHNTYLLKGTVDESNRLAQHYIDLLEATLEQYQRGKAVGMWNVATYLFTSNPNTLGRGMALLRAVYAGESSLPEPIRMRPCHSFSSSTGHSQSQVTKAMGTNLDSKDLATLILLSTEEMPGFSVKDYARFDVSLPDTKNAKSLAIGNVLLDCRSTGNWYEIECDDLAKHGLIVGVTGSGKTNTCFYLLHQLWQEHHIPFLVIEPAKSEYRDIMDVPGFEDLRVFTLGDETIAPFRMNPFEVMPGVHVQSHIDYLKSLFFASFVLYAPMPYVLEQSLHEVYEDKGWNLALNENPRGTSSRSYPTLTDLYYKIEYVVERLGYEERITMDVQAGLRARINSLRIGGKGLMLDVRRSIPMQQLLENPTVLELKQIGDDEEKAFLIGLYLMRLYEYYESQFKLGKQTQAHRLRHLTIIEEAHRLLKNVPTEKASEESSNIKGKAVEAFSNILSEIRAYGEGILIAEQIPVKLAMDAIKNTNLKVMHRLVSQEDREVMGGTMNLDEAQKRYVASISCGTAAVYAEGMDSPFLVQVPNYKGNTLKRTLSDDVVRQQMQQRFLKHFPGLRFLSEGLSLSVRSCASCER
ncbi:TPA: ATP-binding protein [Candidatus Poribacteria bacterium]|nr:ATP-binding protein [Candidatus Poribacteria bacterium]